MRPAILTIAVLAIGYGILRADQKRNDASTADSIRRNIEASLAYSREMRGIREIQKIAISNIRKGQGL